MPSYNQPWAKSDHKRIFLVLPYLKSLCNNLWKGGGSHSGLPIQRLCCKMQWEMPDGIFGCITNPHFRHHSWSQVHLLSLCLNTLFSVVWQGWLLALASGTVLAQISRLASKYFALRWYFRFVLQWYENLLLQKLQRKMLLSTVPFCMFYFFKRKCSVHWAK